MEKKNHKKEEKNQKWSPPKRTKLKTDKATGKFNPPPDDDPWGSP